MVKVRVFLLGFLFVFKHLNCSGKERFRRLLSLPIQCKRALAHADERRNTVLHICRLVLIMDHASRTRLGLDKKSEL